MPRIPDFYMNVMYIQQQTYPEKMKVLRALGAAQSVILYVSNFVLRRKMTLIVSVYVCDGIMVVLITI